MKRTRQLIRDLSAIDRPDFGISATMSGHTFAPIVGTEHPEAYLLTDHDLGHDPALVKLVQLGPRALPLLLRSLTDATPTRLVIEADEGRSPFSLMRAHEISGNPLNPKERALLRLHPDLHFRHYMHRPMRHVVTVGDVCFAIIGEIVGRPYQSVRYQPSGIFIINSPTEDPALAREVRELWSSPNTRQCLLDSLLRDYATRYVGDDVRRWTDDAATRLPSEAVLRLLYYYPTETTALIARQLHNLNVQRYRSAGGSFNAAWAKRESANGVLTDDFVRATSWCPVPAIRAEITRIALRTWDTDILAAALRGVVGRRRLHVRTHIERFLLAKRPASGAMDDDATIVLESLARWWGSDAKDVFQWYLPVAGFTSIHTACWALSTTQTRWDAEVLLPLLDDRRPIPESTPWQRMAYHGSDSQLRVSDAAALALVRWRPTLTFDVSRPYPVLDRQIEAIKTQLRRPALWWRGP